MSSPRHPGIPGYILFSFLALSRADSFAADFSYESGVLPFHAELRDAEDGTQVPFTATTLFVTTGDPAKPGSGRLFGVTSAHIAQGSQWKIGDNLPLGDSVRGTVTDALCDMTLFEVDPEKLPSNQRPKPFATVEYTHPRGSKRTEPAVFAIPESLAAWQRANSSMFGGNAGAIQAEARHVPAYVLSPSWSRRGETESASARSSAGWGISIGLPTFDDDVRQLALGKTYSAATLGYTNGTSVMYSVFGDRLIASNLRLAPGMSGAPLLRPTTEPKDLDLAELLNKPVGVPDPDGGLMLRQEVLGIGAEFIRDMSGSTFCSSRTLARLIDRYVPGENIRIGPSSWSMRNKAPYLQYGPGRSEVTGPQRSAGNGHYSPPGNGHYAPPGAAQERSTRSGIDYWDETRSLPAFEWDGKPAIGFKVIPKSGGTPAFLYPTQATMALILEHGDKLKYQPVPFGANVQEILSSRSGAGTPYFLALPKSFNPALGARAIPSFESRPDGTIEFNLYGTAPESEPIRFTLDQNGALVGSGKSYFTPVIQVKGSQGGDYLVDLRDMFFSDPSKLTVPSDNSDDIQQFEQVLRNRRKAGGGALIERLLSSSSSQKPVIYYRKLGASDYSVRVQFDRTIPQGGEPRAAKSGSCAAGPTEQELFPLQRNLEEIASRCRKLTKKNGGHE